MLLPFALVSDDRVAERRRRSPRPSPYILIYGVMNLGAFAVVDRPSASAGRSCDRRLRRAGDAAPAARRGMTAFMVSLAGVPPTAGFWAKLSIFQAAIERGGFGPWLAGASW